MTGYFKPKTEEPAVAEASLLVHTFTALEEKYDTTMQAVNTCVGVAAVSQALFKDEEPSQEGLHAAAEFISENNITLPPKLSLFFKQAMDGPAEASAAALPAGQEAQACAAQAQDEGMNID